MHLSAAAAAAEGCKSQRRERVNHPAGGKAEGEKGMSQRIDVAMSGPRIARRCCVVKGTGPAAVIDAYRAPGFAQLAKRTYFSVGVQVAEREPW